MEIEKLKIEILKKMEKFKIKLLYKRSRYRKPSKIKIFSL